MKLLLMTALAVAAILTSGCMAFMAGDHMGHHGSHDGSTERRSDNGGDHSH